MTPNRRSPWWPYLLVLAGLLVLSLAVPRGWQSGSPSQSSEPPRGRKVAAAPQKPTTVQPVVVRPMPKSIAPTPSAVAVGRSNSTRPTLASSSSASPALGVPQGDDEVSALNSVAAGSLVEDVSQKIADVRRFAETHRRPDDTAGSTGERQPPSFPLLAANPTERHEIPTAQHDVSAGSQPHSESVAWPVPHRLLQQLDDLAEHLECRDWAAYVQQLCEELSGTPVDERRTAATIVGQMHSLAQQADGYVDQLKDPRAAADLRRVRYSLERRLVAWDLAVSTGDRGTAFANVPTGQQQRRRLAESLAEVRQYLNTTAHGDAWATYLRLDEVAQIAGDNPSHDEQHVRHVARRVLTRLAAPRLDESQRRLLGDKAIQSLAEQLRPLAAEPIDAHKVLADIERYEATGLTSAAQAVTTAQRRLVWSVSKHDEDLAQHVENHYRNANVRAALTEGLLNRFAPKPMTMIDRVHEMIVGTPVHGQSVNTTQIQARLIPDPRRVHFWLEAYGVVDSRTQSSSGPATFNNRGASNYIVRKAVVIGPNGMGIANASTEADTHSRLTDVSTGMDRIPLIGSMVRNLAVSKYDAVRDQARWEQQEKVATKAGTRVDAEVDRRLQQAEDRVRREVIDPLANMDLELEPITLETLTDRATMRLRLAGQHQLGGHTARPQAPSDSLASVQLHESAVNNVLDQLQLASRTFSVPELYRHLAHRLSRPEPTLPDDLPEGVLITFAATDPVRVRCQNDNVRLTLAIKTLQQEERRQWHDFRITATYQPEINGLRAQLVRDGIIELDGEAYKGRPEIVLRGIFAKILSRERKLDLVPAFVVDHPRLADLCITQCTIEDGWIGIALGPDRNVVRSNVARKPAGVKK